MSESLNRLSSGLRINKSADDAAGLAVSESMRAKIRGLAQAKRNANDGISFLQVAEGGLSELSNSMIRMRELTTQAASDTIGSKEREFLNREFEQLGAELTRIKDETEFNGLRVFNTDGIPSEGLAIQVGVSYRGEGSQATEDSDVVRIQLDQLEDLNTKLSDLPSLAITGESGRELGGGETNDIFTKLDDAVGSVTNFRASLGAMQSRMNSTITSIDVSTENLNAAQSRIRDVDYAQETAKLTQSRILASAGTAVLSQANQTPETVLQLLR
jgi:flagellin